MANKVHLRHEGYGSLRNDEDPKTDLGRPACSEARVWQMEGRALVLVKRTKRGVTCKHCLKLKRRR